MKIEELLYKLMTGELTPVEMEVLEKLLSEKPKYRKVFERIKDRKKLGDAYAIYKKADPASAWQKNLRLRHKNKTLFPMMKVVSIAASVIILVGISFLLTRQEKPEQELQIVKADLYKPASTSSVQVIVNSEAYTVQDTVELQERANSLSESDEKLQVMVGHGNTFRFTLPDGSEVCMNAGSKISYPKEFKDAYREIHISGEVFLNVTKDSQHPFLVHYGENNSIRVLGTSFNVKAYPDQTESFVTLVSGRIQFHSGRDSVLLSPSQQVIFDQSTGKTTLRTVDPALYTTWMSDRFAFKYETLENISRELSRWYGVNFKFENHAQKRFTGGFSKYDDIEKILNLLAETTQINFSIQDSCIIVR